MTDSNGCAVTPAMKPSVRVEPVTDPSDIPRFFDVAASTFGAQIGDGVWIAANPGWNTPQGRRDAVARLTERFKSATKDRNGDPNTIFLKAISADPDDPGQEAIAGVAIWVQASMIEGLGDVPVTEQEPMKLGRIYPDNPQEQRFLFQALQSLHAPRVEAIKEAATTSSPSMLALDLCCVDPAFQRRGAAKKLVEWGLAEAKRRGGLESLLEASSMGKFVYQQLGFVQEGPVIEYEVDEIFRGRPLPPNLFMRTGRVAR